MRRFAFVALVAGCKFTPGAAVGVVDALGDVASHDGPADAIMEHGFCYGAAPARICLAQAPTGPMTYNGNTAINTDDPAMCAPDVVVPNDNSLCVVAFMTITVNSSKTVSASGSRPLVLLASTDLHVLGTVDVASHISTTPQEKGAASSATCGAGIIPINDGGGGYGGSFGGYGGAGAGGGGAGTGGVPNTPVSTTPTVLRGGCPGSDANNGGAAGDGGGAVALVAGGTVEVTGTVNASGSAGGGAPTTNHGGGGAGSGGMIVIAATTFTGASSGIVLAAGGGGGEGSDARSGHNGGEPSASSLSSGAPGGNGGSYAAGNGGRGSTQTDLAGGGGQVGSFGTGGGGGGGSAGILVIRVTTTTFVGMVSPPSR